MFLKLISIFLLVTGTAFSADKKPVETVRKIGSETLLPELIPLVIREDVLALLKSPVSNYSRNRLAIIALRKKLSEYQVTVFQSGDALINDPNVSTARSILLFLDSVYLSSTAPDDCILAEARFQSQLGKDSPSDYEPAYTISKAVLETVCTRKSLGETQ